MAGGKVRRKLTIAFMTVALTPVVLEAVFLIAKIEYSQSTLTMVNLLNFAIAVTAGGLVVDWLRKTVDVDLNGIVEGSSQVADASSQISESAELLAEGAQQQASSLEETSSSLQQMSSMTDQNAENSMLANQLSQQAKDAALRGSAAMDNLNQAMNEISLSAVEITNIVKVIEEIAFQTNLLALNAAVEAARAGEQGRGFAVVADEVRNLAQRASDAAKNTTSLIMENEKSARAGIEITENVSVILNEIVGQNTKVADLITEITTASQEQALGVSQVNTSLIHMDQITLQTATSAEQGATAAEELSALSGSLKTMADKLANVFGLSTSDAVSKRAKDYEAKLKAAQAAPAKKHPRSAAPFRKYSIPAAPPGRQARSEAIEPNTPKVLIAAADSQSRNPEPADLFPLDDSELRDF